MKQGITIIGTLGNLLHVDAKDYGNGLNPAYQKLQITVMNESGLSLVDVNDKEYAFKEADLNKPISVAVVYTVTSNGKVSFRLV